MELYFLRHATAVDRGTPRYDDDSQRPLTADGRKQMGRAAKGMKALGLKFDLILSSPYVRAADTAQIVASHLDEEVTFTDFLIPDGNPLELIREISDAGVQRVLLVGHEPDLSGLISILISGGSDAAIELKKGGLCRLTTEKLIFGECATLNWLLTPKQLRAMR